MEIPDQSGASGAPAVSEADMVAQVERVRC